MSGLSLNWSSWDSSWDSGWSDWDFSFPILLDLDNNGVKVTELSQSNIYVDSAGDGLQHRTAWAGEGDGVLFYDADGDGKISQNREYIFTEWDPTATSDMAALRAAFDINGDGKLSGTELDGFKLSVTKADGTTETKLLSDYQITEISLTEDTTNIVLPDGSVITGQSQFTRADRSTGIVANTTLTTEATGYKIDRTETRDAANDNFEFLRKIAA